MFRLNKEGFVQSKHQIYQGQSYRVINQVLKLAVMLKCMHNRVNNDDIMFIVFQDNII